jgi:hypothetical protein
MLCLRLFHMLPPGGLCPSVLLLDTVEDPRNFATLKDVHESTGHEFI